MFCNMCIVAPAGRWQRATWASPGQRFRLGETALLLELLLLMLISAIISDSISISVTISIIMIITIISIIMCRRCYY